jgi:hypothetical protein
VTEIPTHTCRTNRSYVNYWNYRRNKGIRMFSMILTYFFFNFFSLCVYQVAASKREMHWFYFDRYMHYSYFCFFVYERLLTIELLRLWTIIIRLLMSLLGKKSVLILNIFFYNEFRMKFHPIVQEINNLIARQFISNNREKIDEMS